MNKAIKIIIITNQEEKFYPLLGPFLSRRAIVKELGYPIYDDDNKTWFVAMDGTNVAGFCAARINESHADLVSAYVVPNYRNKSIYEQLFSYRLEKVCDHCSVIESTVTKQECDTFLKHKFISVNTRGKYTKFRKEIKHG